jgi:hypothetical protein
MPVAGFATRRPAELKQISAGPVTTTLPVAAPSTPPWTNSAEVSVAASLVIAGMTLTDQKLPLAAR